MSVKIFFCYAHEDESLLKQLQTQLRPLQRQGLIDLWHDRDISAGTEWQKEIDKHLNTADIILLLVSPEFMSSDYCYSIEMKRALERHQRRDAYVVPVILSYVHWQGELLSKLQALPTDAKPVTSAGWHSLNEALFDVAEGVRKIAENISSRQSIIAALKAQPLTPSSRGGIQAPIKNLDQVKPLTPSTTHFPFEPAVKFQKGNEMLDVISRIAYSWELLDSFLEQVMALATYINWMMDALTQAYRANGAELNPRTLELLLDSNSLSYLGNYKFLISRNQIDLENFNALCHEIFRVKTNIRDFVQETSSVIPRILTCIFNFSNAHLASTREQLENQEVWETILKQF